MASFALSAISGGLDIMSGYQANKQAKYNAATYEQQASLIDIQKAIVERQFNTQKEIQARQYLKFKADFKSTTIAKSAKAGLEFSGSPIAVLLDSLTEIGIDESIGKYNIDMDAATSVFNLDQEKIGATAKAAQIKIAGRMAIAEGYSKASASFAKGAYSSYLNSGSGGNTKDSDVWKASRAKWGTKG